MASSLTYVAELGAYFLLRTSLEPLLRGAPGLRPILGQVILPIVLILSLRRLAGQAWTFSDLGIRFPPMRAWVEALWLACFHTTYVLALLLLTARFHYYYLLDFLDRYNRALTGARSNYEVFLQGIFTYALGHFAWDGELFNRGYVQGLGAGLINANAGALSSWLTFGALYALEAAALGYDHWPHAWIWASLALFPGPLFEAFYLRHHSLLPLIGIRFAGGFLPFALAAFFWYWYPDRSFAVSLPFLWAGIALLGLITVFVFRKVSALWMTAGQILKSGWSGALLPALGLIAFMGVSVVIHSLLFKSVVLLAALAGVRFLRKPSPH